jgi:hypothetical protein
MHKNNSVESSALPQARPLRSVSLSVQMSPILLVTPEATLLILGNVE